MLHKNFSVSKLCSPALGVSQAALALALLGSVSAQANDSALIWVCKSGREVQVQFDGASAVVRDAFWSSEGRIGCVAAAAAKGSFQFECVGPWSFDTPNMAFAVARVVLKLNQETGTAELSSNSQKRILTLSCAAQRP